jgi:steroid delta-isomerase-like uncharacterized protein
VLLALLEEAPYGAQFSLEAVMREDMQRIVDSVLQLWNTGNPALAKELYTENAQRYDPYLGEMGQGSQEIGSYVAEVRKGFPDFKLQVDETVMEGDRLVFHWTVTGTQKGEFQNIPATGKQIRIKGLTLCRMEGGKIADDRVYFDRLNMLEQLGVAPDMGQSQAKAAAR